ncbi:MULTISPECIES: bifunctional diaminohydroxyphosphoribosylaminopyrimidine deaminase/5-amino-6-(5-phosphoribosylamino)uracil reductase RibD [Providencia]|uniref:bifunctional diaminohydroxyphosphoribosylaminopyrimidine deaminase/5-amino-6-(5-phosphoribosylamino)uracil reductase RibD n=1 Tax=Providencia TaxID=586 RepID=UPI000838DBDE|nr:MULTISPECIES: bifunctional diaminohydroxyphosphoribosylaminopyrimidine deaminase/5-amino-6-(5-phosphoribosylamino)uracil reductase RibD [Providencia]MBP6123014.1 bifunctional diaminohydroxyphosphoribosylaminopyrimidine deaminase/5-amino-6-(5-phosphoribosylamino)uracil reductase RibD [Providencia sp.]NIH21418.1 bifunctional diaminohydroxyphosphoribosylaminopyrimidine deaminase/5-amino-6-(5-phosphoribosylamino)uracil reductase RibD [Providencia heimbachae]
MIEQDRIYMVRAFELARKGRFTTSPNPNVGCVIVLDGVIVGEGYHQKAGEPHAEVHALRMAGDKAKGATAYVTLEPCSHHGRTPPCAEALINAGVSRVVASMQDPNPQVAGRGLYMLSKAGIETATNLLLEDAEAINRGFLKRMRTGFPYIQLKLAASLDGKTALESGESKWITSPAARQDVQALRAEASAILSTSNTVIADDPSLTVRWNELPKDIQQVYPEEQLRQPIRIVLDNHNRVTPEHKVTQVDGECWLVRSKLDENVAWQGQVEQVAILADDKGIDLVVLMMRLAKRNVNSIWVEAGAKLAGSLLKLGLVDELIVYIAPKLLGDNARGLVDFPALSALSDAPKFEFTEVIKVGDDLRVRLRPIG